MSPDGRQHPPGLHVWPHRGAFQRGDGAPERGDAILEEEKRGSIRWREMRVDGDDGSTQRHRLRWVDAAGCGNADAWRDRR